MIKPKRRNKYNAKSTRRGGEFYPSMAEAGYADVLELLKKAGKIRGYIHHPPAVKMAGGAVKWNVDFLVTDIDGLECYVEVKGIKTEGYRIKLDCYRYEEDDQLPLFVVQKYGELKYRTIESVGDVSEIVFMR